MVIVKGVFAAIVPRLGGLTNFACGIFVEGAIMPIGAGLQEPVLICWPLVIGRLVVAQKLMKLRSCD